jgi:hypothetical protein
VVQEGFMAASICRQEPTDVCVHPRFRRQQDRIDPTINAMSSPCRAFRRGGRRALARRRDSRGTDFPSRRRFVEPMLRVVAPGRRPGRRRAGRTRPRGPRRLGRGHRSPHSGRSLDRKSKSPDSRYPTP